MASASAVSRRRFLGMALVGAAGLLRPAASAASPGGAKTLAFYNLHTGESARAAYWVDGRYVPDVLRRFDWLLRDYRTDEVREIDRGLLDLLSALAGALETREPWEVISGYRSAATNAKLAATTSGVSRASLHVEGMAIDIRLPGRSLEALRDSARALGRGGVGYYPKSSFVHVDVGRVRFW
jgi:uncharacterized protein YcbK (DUF882 family)